MTNEVTMADLAREVGAAAVAAEKNSEEIKHLREVTDALHKRLDKHVIEHNAMFTRMEERRVADARESTRQHGELKEEVTNLSHNIGNCIHNHVEAAVAPVIVELKNHRKVMWSVSGGLIIFLITTLGYVLANGNPWDTAIMNHKNSTYHGESNATVR